MRYSVLLDCFLWTFVNNMFISLQTHLFLLNFISYSSIFLFRRLSDAHEVPVLLKLHSSLKMSWSTNTHSSHVFLNHHYFTSNHQHFGLDYQNSHYFLPKTFAWKKCCYLHLWSYYKNYTKFIYDIIMLYNFNFQNSSLLLFTFQKYLERIQSIIINRQRFWKLQKQIHKRHR